MSGHCVSISTDENDAEKRRSKSAEKVNNSSSLVNEPPKVNKKKKKMEEPLMSVKPPHHYVMIPNGDRRCRLVKMFCDSLNTGEASVTNYFATHCVPDIAHIQQYDRGLDGDRTGHINTLEVQGVEAVTALWMTFIKSAPDLIFRHCKTNGFVDEKSKYSFICGAVECSCTRVREIDIVVEEKSKGSMNDENVDGTEPKKMKRDENNQDQQQSSQQSPPSDSMPISSSNGVEIAQPNNASTSNDSQSTATSADALEPENNNNIKATATESVDSLVDGITKLSFYEAHDAHVVMKDVAVSKSKLLPPEMRQKTGYIGTFAFDLNSDNKIIKFGMLFKEDPSIVLY